MTEKKIGELISEIHEKMPSLRFGQMMFAVVAQGVSQKDITHEKWDSNIAHKMFYLEDSELKELLTRFIESHK